MRKKATKDYDREHKRPVLRCSICTGEQVAGFLDGRDNHFEEVMLIRSEGDLRAFQAEYGIEGPLERIY